MTQASRDQNRVATLLGVSSVDFLTPVTLMADPITHGLVIDSQSLYNDLDARYGSGVTLVSSDPATGTEGQMIINTTTSAMKIYYGGSWQTLHTLSGSGSYLLLEDGFKILGEDGYGLLLE